MRMKNQMLVLALIMAGAVVALPTVVSAIPSKNGNTRYMIEIPNIWETPDNGKKYDVYFRQAELINNLPPGLLSRIAYQESRFREDIITGATKSSAGAVGLMQIVPKWHPDVNPLDPIASINYAGEYMARLYNRFGDWKTALAAYNWGQGNVARKGINRLPQETANYVRDISRDIGLV